MNKIVTLFLLGFLTQQTYIIHAGEKRIVKTKKNFHNHKNQSSFAELEERTIFQRKSVLLKKSTIKTVYPSLSDDLVNKIFSQENILSLLNPSLKSHQRRKLLQSLACISKGLNKLIISPEFTIKLINKLSRGHNQDTIAKQIRVPQTKAYFRANNSLYRDMTNRREQELNANLLANPFVDPDYSPHKRKPLLFAFLNARKITALIQKNADINKTYKGKSLLQVCIKQRALKAIKVILEYNPKEKCLLEGFKSKNNKIIKLILQSNFSDAEYHQALDFLLHKKDIDNLKLLLSKRNTDLQTHLYDAVSMFLSNMHEYNSNTAHIMDLISLLCDHGAWNENAYTLLIEYAKTCDPENGVLSKHLPQEYRALLILLKNNAPLTE